jgi:hypothetical protein
MSFTTVLRRRLRPLDKISRPPVATPRTPAGPARPILHLKPPSAA